MIGQCNRIITDEAGKQLHLALDHTSLRYTTLRFSIHSDDLQITMLTSLDALEQALDVLERDARGEPTGETLPDVNWVAEDKYVFVHDARSFYHHMVAIETEGNTVVFDLYADDLHTKVVGFRTTVAEVLQAIQFFRNWEKEHPAQTIEYMPADKVIIHHDARRTGKARTMTLEANHAENLVVLTLTDGDGRLTIAVTKEILQEAAARME